VATKSIALSIDGGHVRAARQYQGLFRDSSDGRSATRSDGRLNGPKVGVSRA
jgi:hypothetical protein